MDRLTKNYQPDPFVSIEVGSTKSSTSNRSDISGALSPDLPFSPFRHGYYSPCPSYRTRSRNPSSGSNASSSNPNARTISLAAGDQTTTYQYYAKSHSLSSHHSPFGDSSRSGRFSVDGKMKEFRGTDELFQQVLIQDLPIKICSGVIIPDYIKAEY